MSKEIEIKIPTGWNEISIGQFQEIIFLPAELTPRERQLQMVSILCDLDETTLRKLPLVHFAEIQKELTWSYAEPDAVTEKLEVDTTAIFKKRGKKEKKEVKRVFNIDGQDFGLLDLTKLSNGEWIDLEHYQDDNKAQENLHIIMAILYRPIVKQHTGFWTGKYNYEIEEYNWDSVESRAELFKEKMPIDIAYTTALFFSLIADEYTKTFEDSLKMMEVLIKNNL